MMDYETFLNRIIDDGLVAARRDYSKPGQEHKLDGAMQGFEACRKKSPAELHELLFHNMGVQQRLFIGLSEDLEEVNTYWRQVCFTAEVEWVCKVVSAMLANESKPVIVSPTARSTMKAAEILGVAVPWHGRGA